MKDYDAMAERVLKRRDEYAAEKDRKKKKAASVLSCFCLAALLGVGVWRTGIISDAARDAGSGGARLGGGPSGYNMQEELKKQDGRKESMPDDLREIGGTDTPADGALNYGTDAPVQGEAGSTGALTAYEAVWGGSYMDQNGCWVIWLTENTPENQKEVLDRNPDLPESSTIFKPADYSLAYLTELMAKISEGMADGELSFVTTAALREEQNRVEVTMTTDDAESVARVLAFDSAGGAIEIRYTSESITTDEAVVKSPAE